MKLDLPASRICYLIATKIKKINPKYDNPNYSDIVEIALLNLYNTVTTSDNDLKLIYDPMELEEIKTPVNFVDDVTDPHKLRKKVNIRGEI